MTPRKDIIAVPESASLSEILAIYEEDGLSRLVVFGQDLDDIKGVLLMKDLIPLMGKEVTEFKVNDYLREPLFVPDSCDLGDLLKTFRQVGNHLAIVLDEHGGVDGLVTMEDVMEEIVGEIFDEYDTPEEECEIRPAADGELLVDGGVLINDLNQDYEFSFPTGEYDTFAGFVFHVLGKIPQAGEIIDYEGVRIKVEEIEQNRIKLLRILRLEPTPLPS